MFHINNYVATPYGTNGQAKEEEKFWWEKMAAYT
jgi:hypothetical protein